MSDEELKALALDHSFNVAFGEYCIAYDGDDYMIVSKQGYRAYHGTRESVADVLVQLVNHGLKFGL
jgi:hypothetical protein